MLIIYFKLTSWHRVLFANPVRIPPLSFPVLTTIMRWPPWSSNSSNDEDAEKKKKVKGRWAENLNATNWSHYTEPRNLIPTLILTATTLALIQFYRNYLRRIPRVANIEPGFFRRRSLFGRVTSVGDGDDFRMFHTPGGRLAGWEWMPGRKVPTKREELKDRTVCVFAEFENAIELACAIRAHCYSVVAYTDSCQDSRRRRARTGSLWSTGPTVLHRGARVASRLYPSPTSSRLHLPAGSVR